MTMPCRDVYDLLDANGWHPTDSTCVTWFKGGETFTLTDDTLELIDFVFMRGCRWGVARGAYEQQVQEDVEAGDVSYDTQTEEKCPKCLSYYTDGIGGP